MHYTILDSCDNWCRVFEMKKNNSKITLKQIDGLLGRRLKPIQNSLKRQEVILDGHSTTLDSHTETLASQSKTLASLSKTLAAQTEILESHTETLAAHTRTLVNLENETMPLVREIHANTKP